MSALAFTILAVLLAGPTPALLARATWPLRAPRAAMVLWQAIALAAVLSSFSAGIAIASRLLMPGPDGRPTTSFVGAAGRLGWPLWAAYITVFALTVLVGARLAVAVVRVATATRRRRAHHRMVVDLVGVGHNGALAQPCARARDLRVLDVAQPLAYCLPGVRSRVVVSEGTLTALADAEVAAILTHERAHLRARHDLVLEAFTAVHAAFPRLVRSANALGRCSYSSSSWPMTPRCAPPGALPGSGIGRLCVRAGAVGCVGRRRSQHGAPRAPAVGAWK